MRIYKDASNSSTHGEQYTGTNFPGRGSPPLEIDGNSFNFYFHSGASSLDVWCWMVLF